MTGKTSIAMAEPRAAEPAAPPSRPRPRQRRADHRRHRIAAWATIVVLGTFGLFPIYWTLVTALTPSRLVFGFPPRLFPQELTFDHFTQFFGNATLLRFLFNSAVVALCTTVLTLVVASMMGYSFSKFRYRGRGSLMYLVLSSQMFPHALLLITLYLMYSELGLLNSYTGLVLSFTAFTLPLCVWLLKSFFDTIPDSLLEAAALDGAPRWKILVSIVLPLAKPGLLAAGLFAFVRGWNDFIFALTLAGPEKMTLPPGLVNTYIGEFQTSWPDLMAASLVVSIPVVVAFIALQRYLVGGMVAGAVRE
jgi:multiple sugar transport system permease protein